jgi:hypothetical protein
MRSYVNQDPVSQQVWHVKEPSKIQAIGFKRSPVTGNGDSGRITENSLGGYKQSKLPLVGESGKMQLENITTFTCT